MNDISVPMCFKCRHFERYLGPGQGYACRAFPERIPQDIAMGVRSHTTPYPADQGIQFEPRPRPSGEGRKLNT